MFCADSSSVCLQEMDVVLQALRSSVGLGTWRCLLEGRREAEFAAYPKLRKGWKKMQSRYNSLSKAEKADVEKQETFFWNLMHKFFVVIRTPMESDDELHYAERIVELLTDLEVRHSRLYSRAK